jgi:hypothetical protein
VVLGVDVVVARVEEDVATTNRLFEMKVGLKVRAEPGRPDETNLEETIREETLDANLRVVRRRAAQGEF